MLAIGLLTATLLTFGRQIAHWWTAVPTVVTAPPAAGVDFRDLRHGGESAWFEFGDLPLGWRQQSARGTEAEAQSALRAALQRVASAGGDSRASQPPQAGERRLLDLLAQQNSAGEELLPGHEWLELHGPLAGGVIVRQGPGRDRAEQRRTGRVVAWGLRVPAEGNRWNLHLFANAAGVSVGQATQGLQLPGGRRILVVGNGSGGQLQLWRGTASLDEWQQALEDWLKQSGWTRDSHWQQSPAGRRAAYRRTLARDTLQASVPASIPSTGRESGVVSPAAAVPGGDLPLDWLEINLCHELEQPAQLTAWFQFGTAGR